MEIGEEINPRKPEEAIAHIKRDAERRIAEIDETSREDEAADTA